VRYQNGSNKVAIELRGVQFWSEIILVISNRTRATRSFDFDITRMISDLTVPKFAISESEANSAVLISYDIKSLT